MNNTSVAQRVTASSNNISSFNNYIHIVIGLLSLSLGYPLGGSLFILAMAPYLIYMVLKCDAKFLPALVLHCASETSATSIVFFSFALLSVINYRQLARFKLTKLFWALFGIMPIFIWLIYESIFNHEMYPPLAIAQTGYYLAFFAFFYGVLITKTFTNNVLSALLITLFIVYLLYVIDAIEFVRITIGFTYIYSALLALFVVRKENNYIIFSVALVAFLSIVVISSDSTLTTLFVCIMSFLLVIAYYNNKKIYVHRSLGIAPFIIIIFLYYYGITTYMNTSYVPAIDSANIASWNNILSWMQFKFFYDRAPFWAGGFYQIVEYKHLFPIPNMPDILALFQNHTEREISFGSHTTIIELIRLYGIISGIILNVCLIYIVMKARNVFGLKIESPRFVSLFSMAIVTTITLTLTGQYQILPGYAILSLGILGVMYGTYARHKHT